MTDMEYENKEICAKFGGKCCKKSGWIFIYPTLKKWILII